MKQENSGISKFPEKRITSRDGPKFSKQIWRNFLFHAILNWNFRKCWSNGTCPLFQLKHNALSEVKFCENKRRRASATTDSTHAEKEVATSPSSGESVDLPAGADSCSSTSAQSLQLPGSVTPGGSQNPGKRTRIIHVCEAKGRFCNRIIFY